MRTTSFKDVSEIIKMHMRVRGITFDDLRGRCPESYRRWTNKPNEIRIQDLADLLNQLRIPQEEQEEILLKIYRKARGRKVV